MSPSKSRSDVRKAAEQPIKPASVGGDCHDVPSWQPRTRLIVSLLIVFHLFAVFVAPMSNPPPSSQLFNRLSSLFSPYLQALFLNHGYRFFAPEPGPSHLVRYEIYSTETEQPGEFPEYNGIFPDRRKHWPRLIYHRWFMLSETVFAENSLIPSEEDFTGRIQQIEEDLQRLRNDGESGRADWLDAQLRRELELIEYSRKQQQRLLEAIAQHLLRVHEGRRIKLYLCERQLAPMIDVIQGKRLDDPLYFNSNFEFYLGSTLRDDSE